jgi:hypothetical protein
LSEVFCMTTRRDSPTLIDTILAFEWWIFILELFIMGQQSLHAPRVEGVDSPRLLHSSGLCRFDLQAVNSNPSNYLLAGNALLLFESWLLILWLSLYFGPQCHEITWINDSVNPYNHNRHRIKSWASVPRLFLIQGQQFLKFDPGAVFSPLNPILNSCSHSVPEFWW